MGGIEFAAQLERARVMNHPGTDGMTQMFIRNELDAMWNADMWIWRIGIGKGLPIRAVYPCEGTIYSHNAASILRNAKHPEAARAWIDHVTSKEIQEWITRTTYTQTAATDVELPAEMAQIPVAGAENIVYDIPWEIIAAKTVEYKKLWQQHVPQ